MKNVSKIVQLALVWAVIFTGQNIDAAFPQPVPHPELTPAHKTRQQPTSLAPSAPPISPRTRGSLYPPLNIPTAPSIKSTTTSQKIALKRPSSSQAETTLTADELLTIKSAAGYIQKIWSLYLLTMQQEDGEVFYKDDWKLLTSQLKELETAISKLKNPELSELYAPIKKVFSSTDDIWNIEIVATHLYNLISALNQFADTSYDLTDIAQYLKIEAQEHPLYGAYGGFTDWLYSWGDKPREAWSSAKQTASSAWESARQKVQYAKSFVGQPSEEEFNAATARLAEIKRIEQIAEEKRTKTDEALLNQYKLTESRDRAMIAKWWPYLVTVATAGAFYYMFPEFSKNVAGYGIGAAGYVAKPALASAAAYGGYRLLQSDEKKKTPKKRGVEKPTPMKSKK